MGKSLRIFPIESGPGSWARKYLEVMKFYSHGPVSFDCLIFYRFPYMCYDNVRKGWDFGTFELILISSV